MLCPSASPGSGVLQGEALGVFAAGGGGEDDEPLGLVICGEDQAVECDQADRGVSDALVCLGGQGDLVLFP